jgi:hypothetical protein
MAKVTILSPVHHDGKDLEVGKIADLPEEAAESLISTGAAQPVAKKSPANKPEVE